jgi:hypothetical protein
MRQYLATAYQFNELSLSAKEKAKYDHKANVGFSSDEEYLESLQVFAETFDARLYDYAIDWFGGTHSWAQFIGKGGRLQNELPELTREEIAARLERLGAYDPETLRGTGECKLTGYCADESALDGFRKAFFAGASDLKTLLEAGFRSWLEDAQNEAEGQYEDKNFGEHCEINDYEFNEKGELL